MSNIVAPTREQYEVKSEGVTISSIVWQRFKRPMPGLIELIMEENQDLEEAGTEIPVGTTVTIPIPSNRDEAQTVEKIKLF